MRSASFVFIAILVAGTFAGCLNSPAPAGSTPTPSAPAAANVTAPKVSAITTLADLKAFSSAYPYRQAGDPEHVMSRDWLEKAMKDAGLEVVRQKFPMTGTQCQAPNNCQAENVIGIKWGTDKTHWVVIGGHYDVTEGALYGTYDDGSGTMETVEMAKSFAKVPTDRTIAFILFDQEERGLVGSKVFVDSVKKGTFQYNVTVDSMIDLDMVGIMHPHPAKLVGWQNSAQVKALSEERRKAVGVPDAKMEYRHTKGGSSDGVSFINGGIPTIYYWSDWDEYIMPNGQAAPVAQGYVGTYPWWHKVDTYESMVASAGDEKTLQAGFQNLLDIVSPMLLRMSQASFQADVDAS